LKGILSREKERSRSDEMVFEEEWSRKDEEGFLSRVVSTRFTGLFRAALVYAIGIKRLFERAGRPRRHYLC
jgi:hypothetical protein